MIFAAHEPNPNPNPNIKAARLWLQQVEEACVAHEAKWSTFKGGPNVSLRVDKEGSR